MRAWRPRGGAILRRAIGAVLFCAVLGQGRTPAAAPFVPKNDAMVLESGLPSADPRVRVIRRFEAWFAARPNDQQLALQLANIQLMMGIAEADPRFVGNAQATVARWWHARAPVAMVVMRARILEARHAFIRSRRSARAALALDPKNVQALIVLVSVDEVIGKLKEAKTACETIARVRPGLLAKACLASVDSLTGHAEQSYRMLKRAVDHRPSMSASVQIWALTVLSEIGWHIDAPDAERYFKAALAFDRDNVYVLTIYSDYLLDHGRAAEILPLLKGMRPIDALYVRLALAAQATGDKRLAFYRKDLAARFAEAQQEGSILYLREAARFALDIEHHPRRAVALATRNWAISRTPLDARVLVDAAAAAHDPAAARPVAEFVARTHLEDTVIARCLKELGYGPRG